MRCTTYKKTLKNKNPAHAPTQQWKLNKGAVIHWHNMWPWQTVDLMEGNFNIPLSLGSLYKEQWLLPYITIIPSLHHLTGVGKVHTVCQINCLSLSLSLSLSENERKKQIEQIICTSHCYTPTYVIHPFCNITLHHCINKLFRFAIQMHPERRDNMGKTFLVFGILFFFRRNTGALLLCLGKTILKILWKTRSNSFLFNNRGLFRLLSVLTSLAWHVSHIDSELQDWTAASIQTCMFKQLVQLAGIKNWSPFQIILLC